MRHAYGTLAPSHWPAAVDRPGRALDRILGRTYLGNQLFSMLLSRTNAGIRHTTCLGFVDFDQTSLTFCNVAEARSSGSSRPGLGGQSDLRAIACVTLASCLRPATGRPPLTARDGRWIAFRGAHNSEINFLVCYLAVTTQGNDIRLASVLWILTKDLSHFWNIAEARPGPGRSGNHWESSGSTRPALGGQSDLRAIACVTLAARLRPATGRPPLTARDGRWIAFWGAHNSEINFLVCYLAVTTQGNDIRLASVL